MTAKQLVFTQDFGPLGLPGSGSVLVAQCYRAGNFVYMTGQTGFTFEGVQIGVGDAAAQTRQACENVEALMEKAGGTAADVVRLIVYVTARELLDAVLPLTRARFRDACETVLVVKGLARPDMLVELDAWGFIDGGDARKRLVRSGADGAPQCYRAGNHVYLQGVNALDLDGNLVGAGDPGAQARQAGENLKTLMEMAGGSLSDVVRCVYSVTERSDRLRAYPVITDYLARPALPCGTGLVVEGLAREELKIHIDAWGYIDGDGASKQLVHSQDLTPLAMPGNTGPAALCYRAGNHVYVTGQTAFTLDGKLLAPGDPAAQARQACENIQALMEMAGGSLSDIVRVVVYVTDRAHREAAYPVINEYLGEPYPCGTGVVVKGLAREELVVEIDAWGFIEGEAT